MDKSRRRQVRLLDRFPSIKSLGLAVEYFPRYVNRRPSPHFVDVVLLSVMLRGRGRHYLDGEVFEEAGGSVAVTHYGQEHDIVTDARGMDIFNVYLDLRAHALPVLPAELRSTLSAILPLHPGLRHNFNRRVRIGVSEPARLEANLTRIGEEMNGARPGASEVIRHCFQLFLIDLCREAMRHGWVSLGGEDEPPWTGRIRRRLEEDFASPQSLGDLAASERVSVASLCRTFKASTGRTVVEFLIERRIQAAMWKLREGDEKILSIAMSCGFNDLAYFNRTFRRVAGVTPSAYRLRVRR